MAWSFLMILIIAFLLFSLAAFVIVYLWQRRNKAGSKPLMGLMLAVVCAALPHLVSITSNTLDAALVWHYLSLPGIKAVPVFWLIFSARLFESDRWLTRARMFFLAVIPVLTTLLAWTNSWHGWYYSSVQMNQVGEYTLLDFQQNFAFWVGLIYSITLIAIGDLFILLGALARVRLFRSESIWLGTGAFLPLVTYSLFSLKILPFDLTPFTFVITCLIWSFAIYRFNIIDTLPVTDSKLIAYLPVGILVMDANGKLVEINSETCRLLNITKERAIGKPMQVLAEYPGARSLLPLILQGKPGDLLMTAQDGPRWLQIDHPSLRAEDNPIGWRLVVLQDITTRKRAEKMQEASYQIAEKASSTHNLLEFYQGIHATISQQISAKNLFIALYDLDTDLISFPYFVDEKDPPPQPRKPRQGLTEYILRTGEPLLISPEVTLRLKTSHEAYSIGTASIDWVGVPLKDDRGTTFGVLAVQTYTEGIRYTQQDVEFLSFVSRQIGMAIQRISALERIRQSEERFRSLVEGHGEGMGIVDKQEYITFSNHAADLIFGVAPDSLVGKNLGEFLDQQGFERVREQTSRRELGESTSYEITITRPDGQKREILVTATPQFNAAGEFTGTFGVFRDITDRKKDELQLAFLGTHDTLTGLFNRNYFETRLSHLVYPNDYPLSIIILDLDELKKINDTLGHTAGDSILKALAGILRESFRQEDTISRIGGDEFVVILRHTSEPVAQSIFNRFLENLAVYNQAHPGLPIQVSAGFASAVQATHYEDLFRQADELMYVEKRNHKSSTDEYHFP